ncbi:DUF2381 family protein [Hyalangium minutum]|uniref:DUF2381 family protein n=1 Tax=Hyalangium minutum TaxID=394096 RepID=A0A085WEF4_9BACT|nr:DUF2381 family protein [Hyalangium minutum]KFE66067.1 hypothetical protein DB31_1132 [Hyalangium minutum]
MRDFLPCRFVLFAILVSSVALGSDPREKIVIRDDMLSDHPGLSTSSVYVSGQIATVLHFEKDVDPTKTKLLGWEGRFEPLVVGSKMVVLMPLRNLDRDEVVPLLVTLGDGTEIPFSVKPQSLEKWGWTDHQVNVFKDREGYNAVLSSLNASLKRERELRGENERLKQEETSVDHALATLLSKGQEKKTPFHSEQVAFLKDSDMEIVVETFSGPGKAAVVIHLKNTYSDEPWRFRDARLIAGISGYSSLPFALRIDRAEIVPGQSGTIAVVMDQSAFESKEGLRDLALEIFRKDGLRQVLVNVDHRLVRK